MKGRLGDLTKEPQYHVILDMGAGSTVATVVAFQNVDYLEKGKNVTYPELRVVSVGSDRFIGGQDLDTVIRTVMIDKFKEMYGDKIKSKVEDNLNAMSKFSLHAVKVKESMVKLEMIKIQVRLIHYGESMTDGNN